MTRKVLFVDSVHPVLEERLEALGYTIDKDLNSSKDDIEENIQDYFGLVIRSRFPLDKQFFSKAKNLKFIARSGAGLENIDLESAKKHHVEVFNSPEGNKDAVGEHAIGMLLMLFNQLKKGDSEVRKAVWDREGNRGLEISGKTVGVVGYGHMGSALAKKLSGFGCQVVAYDKYKKDFSNDYVQEVTLQDLFLYTDILSIHLPLSEETHHYVDEVFISKFQKPIYLINTARGNNVDLEALVQGLKSGKIAGACLDVLEYETASFERINERALPESFVYLTNSDKVILSPHVAGWTHESYVKLSSYLADKIEQHFA